MASNSEIIERDLRVVWHPCTQMKDFETWPMLPVKSGEGVWLYDFDGNRYIDAVSSWWVNLFGHSNPRINARIKDQLEKLEHVIMAGCTQEPVIELSERLVNVTPPGLDHVFYADNGSSAMEIALKMSFHHWQNVGKPRKNKFVTLSNSYHGETLGTLAVGGVDLFKKTYEPLLPLEVYTAPSPDCYYRERGESWEEYSKRQFFRMKEILAKHHEEIAAVTVEPLVQCAGGMRMYHPVYLTMLREACDQYNVHLIADEIAVGFGRTGTLFACEQAGIAPDFMALSKGLTAGYLPLSAVLTTNEIYQAFYDDYEKLTAFLHSHSYTGNPLCCAAALATLEIFEQDDVITANRELAAHMEKALEPFHEHPHVGDVRQTGMIAAIEMVRDRNTMEPYEFTERRGMHVYKHALTREALLRPLGNVCYFMPPYVITPEQIDHLAQVAWEGINVATRGSV